MNKKTGFCSSGHTGSGLIAVDVQNRPAITTPGRIEKFLADTAALYLPAGGCTEKSVITNLLTITV